MDCIFCKIAQNEIPSTKIHEDDLILAFNDMHPQAPVHILVIPKQHIASINDINTENSGIIARIFECIPHIAHLCGLENGYRLISNCGSDACQSVGHLHYHILGGKKLSVNMG